MNEMCFIANNNKINNVDYFSKRYLNAFIVYALSFIITIINIKIDIKISYISVLNKITK